MNGTGDKEDENSFSDEDFDTLPDSTIKQLEEDALLSTQGPRISKAVRTRSTSATRNTIPVRYGTTNALFEGNTGEQIGDNPFQLGHPTYDNIDEFEWIGDDDDVPTPVDERRSFLPEQKIPGEMTQREQWRKDRFGQSNEKRGELSFHERQQEHAQKVNKSSRTSDPRRQTFTESNIPMEVDTTAQQHNHRDRTPHDDAMQARIDELLGERDDLTSKLHKAKLDVETKQGEISIIRAGNNKDSKIYERQMSSLKRALQEADEKHKATVQDMRIESIKIASENQYLKHELNEELGKTKTLQHQLKAKALSVYEDNHTTTPKKVLSNSLRDGFDDDEIMAMSPSRTGRTSKASTPTAVGKRKRKANFQSPVRPLALRQPENQSEAIHKEPSDGIERLEKHVPVNRNDLQADRNLKFLQNILSYNVKISNKSVVETLLKFALPSDSTRTFSAILLEKSAKLQGRRFQAELSQIFIDFWTKALKEKYFECIATLLEIVDYMIDLEMGMVDRETLDILLPVLQDSVTINAANRFKSSPVNHGAFGQFRQTPQSVLNHLVDGTACLSLLYKLACIVEDETPLIEHFWSSVRTDFVLMMLNVWQPIVDIMLMIQLLKTSILPSTFGNVLPMDEQAVMETYIIERVSYLLWEIPKVDEGLEPYTPAEICKFRLEAMKLLTVIAIGSSPPPHDDPDHHGSKLIAYHHSAIARIVRSLYDEVNAMYMLTSSHELHAELVNRGVRLLYHLVQIHGAEINMPEKLSAVNGGIHKHRVVLSRLAFSEGIFIDRLITNETVAMAINMLEESVTPDEADQLLEVFPHFKGRHSSSE